jgi:hypothetical protein
LRELQVLKDEATKKILIFCDKWIPIYERKNTQYKLASLTKKLRIAVRKHFKEREQGVLIRLEWAWKQMMEATARRLNRVDWIALHIYDTEEEQAMLATLLQSFYVEAGEEGSATAMRIIGNKLNRKLVYSGSMEWIQNNAIKFGKKYSDIISDTTNQKIRDEIANAIRQGEDLNGVMKRISSVYSDAEGYRSEMIARTEMRKSYNASSIEQEKAVGIKSWIWSGCDPTCDICGPFMGSNPHTFDEVESFNIETHPNCDGQADPEVPEDFVPNEVYA